MKEQELILDNFKIRYAEQYSDGAKPVFVFLHGWASSMRPFESIIKTVPNYFAFDYPGFSADTELLTSMDLDAYTDLTKKLLDKKLADKQIIFVAHSFGGRVLINLLNKYPMTNVRQTIWIGVPFMRNYNAKHKAIEGGAQIAKKVLSLLPSNLQNDIRKKLYKVIGSDYGAIDSEALKQTFKNIIEKDISTMTVVLPKYNPYFIWGEDDIAAPLPQARTIATMNSVPIRIIPFADHFPFLGKTQEKFLEVFDEVVAK